MQRFELFVNGEESPRGVADERRTIKRVLRGDHEQFRHLVERHKNQILNLVMRQTGEFAIAEDLTQEIFIKAFRGLAQFRFESSFATWLTCIAVNHLNSHFASRSHKERKRTHSITDQQNEAVHDPHKENDGRRELAQRFRAALEHLNPVHREVLVLVALEGKSYEETAGMLCIPLGTVRSRLNKARQKMKELMLG